MVEHQHRGQKKMTTHEKSFGNRLAFLGVVAWISVCLLVAGMYPELHQRLSSIWILSGLLGLGAAVGLAEVVKRELRQQARMIQAFKTEAYTDSLTRLSNRRALDEGLNSHLTVAKRTRDPLAFILVDIDYFKAYNDTHGHGAGDELLRVISKIMQDSFRDNDLVARYGGEEFAIALPQTEKHSAIRVARRLREAVEIHTAERAVGQGVTISLGLTMAKPSDTTEVLMTRADAALYVAKNSGRNCGFLEDADGCHPLEPAIDLAAPDNGPPTISLVG